MSRKANRTTPGSFDKKTRGASGQNNFQVEAFAWVGDRYALTGQQGSYWYGDENGGINQRALGTTDRPVYRPGQTVNFRQIVTDAQRRRLESVGGRRKFEVTANNPKGEADFSQRRFHFERVWQLSTASFTLPAETPLGRLFYRRDFDQMPPGEERGFVWLGHFPISRRRIQTARI